MTDYFTLCAKPDVEILKQALVDIDKHSIIEVIETGPNDIFLQTFENNKMVYVCDTIGKNPGVVVHSRK
jgi:hypothetical protein